MDGKNLKIIAMLLAAFFLPRLAQAAMIELSATGAYSKTSIAEGYNGYKSSEHRYHGSIAFKFTPISAIEFEYGNNTADVSYLTNVGTLVSYLTPVSVRHEDKVMSVSWVQSLVPSSWIIQPYAKIGGGRMNRTYTENYTEFGTKQSYSQNVVTGVAGVGLRIFLTRNFALKGEFETYVPKFHFVQWKTNETFSSGVSWTF